MVWERKVPTITQNMNLTLSSSPCRCTAFPPSELLDWLLIGDFVFYGVTVLLRVVVYGLDEHWNRSKFVRAFSVLFA